MFPILVITFAVVPSRPQPCSAALTICAQTNSGQEDRRKVVVVGAVGGLQERTGKGRIKGEREALWGLKEDFIPDPSFRKMSKKAGGDGWDGRVCAVFQTVMA